MALTAAWPGSPVRSRLVSASGGLVQALPGEDTAGLRATADHLMYQAKAVGGGQVAVQDLEYELDEVFERPGVRSRDLLRAHDELAVPRGGPSDGHPPERYRGGRCGRTRPAARTELTSS